MAIRDYRPAEPESAKSVGELFFNARRELLVKHPFSGSMALHLAPYFTADPKMPTSCTDGTTIALDAEFFKKLSLEERMVVIAHNVWHCALLHWDRQKHIGNDAFDYAADLEIDLLLQNDHFSFPVLPHEEEWEELSLEQVCGLLPAKIDRKLFWDKHLRKEPHIDGTNEKFPVPEGEKDGENEGEKKSGPEKKEEEGKSGPSSEKGKNPADPDGKSEESDKGEGNTGDKESQEGKGNREANSPGKNGKERNSASKDASATPVMDSGAWKKIRRECAGRCKERGTLPADMAELFLAGESATQNWKELLRDYITMCISCGRTWIPPNRRHVYRKLYLPGRSRQTEIEMVIAVDTSGSTYMYLQQFLDELCAIFRSFGEYHVTIINCDAEISSVEEYASADGENFSAEYEFSGGGGTDLRPPFRYVGEAMDVQPQCLLYFTDGFGPAPAEPPAYPVLWCLTPDGAPPADWGDHVFIGEKENG